MNPMDLKRGIDLAVDRSRRRPSEEGQEDQDLDAEVAQVGTISANGDKPDRPDHCRSHAEGRQ
jgi:chaperonin GroEL (HSP60 family)